ncbi:MAG: DUF427 domain-containing protein [Gemmatimonadaceae bacterium]|nr:DUF427 domain-containing protein [Acetobacteraceae bacterium]
MERVADYPRPPRLERDPRRVQVVFAGVTIVDTDAAWRVLETTHPPSFYLPMSAFAAGTLVGSARSSFCEWKGHAQYFSIHAAGRVAADCAWGYADPSPAFAAIRDHVALYAGPMDGCFVDGERVVPQEGGFYGGWITSELIGPFKGGPGTMFW